MDFKCEYEHCKSHEHVEKTMHRLEALTTELQKSNMTLISVVKDITDITKRIDVLEKNQGGLMKKVYIGCGIFAIVALIIPPVLTYVLRGM